MELSSRAVADARQNAALNDLTNISLMRGAVEKLLPRLFGQGCRPDVLVLDPPRQGCHRLVLEALVRHPVLRLIYLSCDPGTLARDLGYLAEHGYRVVEVRPVDMFPQTHHSLIRLSMSLQRTKEWQSYTIIVTKCVMKL